MSEPALADRVRALLAARAVAEKRMMGALVFMIDGAMACGVSKDGLLVRVGAERRERALQRPHVRPMIIGARTVKGFVRVDTEGCASETQLRGWIEAALGFLAALERERKKTRRRIAPRRASKA